MSRYPPEYIAASRYYATRNGCSACSRVLEVANAAAHVNARNADAVEEHLLEDLEIELGVKVPVGPHVRDSYLRDLWFHRHQVLDAPRPDPPIVATARKRSGCLICLMPVERGDAIAKVAAREWVHVAHVAAPVIATGATS